ncbi:hypothetical protein H0H87_002297 [Tephrocybe sp. NHM501043]|nr:hypothetical protein H0H87_002297 [Tephrocybe sp. NHM501043]
MPATLKLPVNHQLTLLFTHPSLYQEAIAAHNMQHLDWPFMPLSREELSLNQVYMSKTFIQNFCEVDAICVLMQNYIPVEWVDHVYTYGMVYLEYQFLNPNVSIDLYQNVNNEHHEQLLTYRTPAAIASWDGWHQPTMDNQYKHMVCIGKEHHTCKPKLEANGLYYPVSMDLNVDHLHISPMGEELSAHLADITAVSLAMTNVLGDVKMKSGHMAALGP